MTKPSVTTITNEIPTFKYWTQRVLPQVYDDSMSYAELLYAVIKHLNDQGVQVNTLTDFWNEVSEWVMNDGLTENVEEKLDSLVVDGTMDKLINQNVFGEFNTRLGEKANAIDVRSKTTKIVPEDFSDEALSLVTGTSGINVLSVPQESSVTTDKIPTNTLNTFVSYKKPFDIEAGTISSTTGENSTATTEARLRTGFILVEPGDILSFDYPNVTPGVYEYDLSKTFTQYGGNTLQRTFTTAMYIRVVFTPTPTDTVITGAIREISNAFTISPSKYRETMRKMGYDAQTVVRDYITSGKNLFNKESVVEGYLMDNGVPNTSTSYKTSDFMFVEKDQNYFIKKPRKIAVFDITKGLVDFQDKPDFTDTVLTPGQDGFIRISVANGDVDTAQVEKGSSFTGYEPYKQKLKYGEEVNQETPLSELEGKTILNLGDSIAYGAETSGTGYADIIASKYNMSVYDYSQSGATIADVTATDPTRACVQHKLDLFISENPGVTPDFILVEGGANDMTRTTVGTLTAWDYSGTYDTTQYSGGLESVYHKIVTTFPTSKVIFVTVHKMSTRVAEDQDTFRNMAVDVSEKWSIPVADVYTKGRINTHITEHKTLFVPDGTHPGLEGYNEGYVPIVLSIMKSI